MKSQYSISNLKRWSIRSKEIESVPTIKAIHVYDFDNTLFCSPLPNPQLWQGSTIGQLKSQEIFAQGGWWHDASVLMATGEGYEKEESAAWEGSWNETIVELVKCSMATKDALTVLLTGRGETNFSDVIQRMCTAKKLDFDLIALKPEVGPTGISYDSTMSFKQAFLHELVFTYKNADEILVYEDRQKHCKQFRDYFERLNKSFLSHPVDQPAPPRKPITAEVIAVCELKSNLRPDAEVEIVQRAITKHNLAISTQGPNPCRAKPVCWKISQNFIYFGHLISQTDSTRLIGMTTIAPNIIDSGEVKLFASSILISPHYPKKDVVDRAGGRGKRVTWAVNGVSRFEDRIWAVRVEPIGEAQVYTQDATPVVVIALRKGSRPIDAQKINNWTSVSKDKGIVFTTTVGDKVMLRLEETRDPAEQYSYTATRGRTGVNGNGVGHKRKLNDDNGPLNKENWPKPGERDDGTWVSKPRGGDRHGQGRYFSQQQKQQSKANFNNKANTNSSGNAGQRNRSGAGGPGGNANQKNRGGNRVPGYKSLDDHGLGNFDGANDMKGQSGGEMIMNY